MEKIYTIQNLHTNTYCLLRKQGINFTEIAKFKSLTQGIDVIKSIFKKYNTQKKRIEPLKEYKAMYESLLEILKIFCVDAPVFFEEEILEKENLVKKLSEITKDASDLISDITTRVLWYSQETPGPFCYKLLLQDGTDGVVIQHKEDKNSFVTSKIFEAESFIKILAVSKEIDWQTYATLQVNIRKIFSEILLH